jgi:hypothetical protein
MSPRFSNTWQRLRYTLLGLLFLVATFVVIYTSGTRAASCGVGTIASLRAIGDDGNVPGNVLDNNLGTRWSYQKIGAWIAADLGAPQEICGAAIAWYQGDTRINHFVLQGSADGATYTDLFGGDSRGGLAIEQYSFTPAVARYLRVVVNGNTHNNWASITELQVNVSGGGPVVVGQPTPGIPAPTTIPAPTSPAAPTAVPAPTAPPAQPPSSGGSGIWLSSAEIAKLPMSGSAWSRVKSDADGSLGSPNIADQVSQHDTKTLAAALVYARTGQASYRAKAADAIISAIGTEKGGRTLALARNLVSYVIAADLINLKSYDAGKDQQFRSWLAAVRNETLDGKTLISTHEVRPNNWGTHAGASRIAADLYLGDKADLAKAAQVFKGWLGDRAAYVGFTYGQLDWQADPSKPVGINPKGATKSGHSIDGVLPDDQRRAGGFTWPAQKENYVWEALQGAVVQAELLSRAGYDAWNWSDKAMWRAINWEYNVNGFPATGDDTWQIYIINKAYGTSFSTSGASTGKNMDYTDWMYGK